MPRKPDQDDEGKGARRAPVVLCVLDGWGDGAPGPDNAIHQAETPNLDRMAAECPRARLGASGPDVGLPEGQMGNSEVGHMNLGAGRVVLQNLPLIDQATESGELADNPALGELIEAVRAGGGTCHLMGLLSPGGVHSHADHIRTLAETVSGAGVAVRLHAFLDGRDTPPASAKDTLAAFMDAVADLGDFALATVSGRYYAMDRDQRWERVALAYAALVSGAGETAADGIAAIEASYAAGVTDEFMRPAVIGDYAGMADGDAVLMANFRADRVRQILTALLVPEFDGFERPRRIDFAAALGMTEYSADLNRHLATLFPRRPLEGILGQVVAAAGLSQLRIAETEKYAHVTFFLNGGEERVFEGEERILVPSPKVATYDLAPEMSAVQVTDRLIEAIATEHFDLIVVNYANGDMVGHTGIAQAAVRAAAAVDRCLGRLEAALKDAGGTLLITADHGNAECMWDPEIGAPLTAHTLSPVPVLLVNPPAYVGGLVDGVLADVAPTLLNILGLEQPAEMTGHSLIVEAGAEGARRRRHATA